MTNDAIDPGPADGFCPFDLKPGAKGRWLLWWAKEKTWIASFPSLEVAQGVVTGSAEDWPSQPGWDMSKFPLDVKVALKRIQRKTGKLPKFKLSEDSNIFDLYAPLGLGFEALSRLMYYEAFHQVVDQVIDSFCPIVAQCLSGVEGLNPDMVARMAPVVTDILFRQTKSQMRLVDEMTASRRTVSKLKASKVKRMGQEELLYVVTKYDLDVDISKFGAIKSRAVAAELAALGLLKK